VTNQGGRTCHAAIVARELGIPAIVGAQTATGCLKTGEAITVCCAEGEEGHVYEGILPFEVSDVSVDQLPKTRTAIMMNVGNPQDVFSLAEIPNDGVELARLEFICLRVSYVVEQRIFTPHNLWCCFTQFARGR
jgi:pyruvate,water dikinase